MGLSAALSLLSFSFLAASHCLQLPDDKVGQIVAEATKRIDGEEVGANIGRIRSKTSDGGGGGFHKDVDSQAGFIRETERYRERYALSCTRGITLSF